MPPLSFHALLLVLSFLAERPASPRRLLHRWPFLRNTVCMAGQLVNPLSLAISIQRDRLSSACDGALRAFGGLPCGTPRLAQKGIIGL